MMKNEREMKSSGEVVVEVSLDCLVAHPGNSNEMSDEAFAKLKDHLGEHGRYPPLIVRKHRETKGKYQLIDGHHRAAALRGLGCETARCVVWEVGDDETLVLLATLNRLRGRDDPRKRAALLAELSGRFERKDLSARLPESPEKLSRLLEMHARPMVPRLPERLEDMPVAVHFFLQPEKKRALERVLRLMGGAREEALMMMVERVEKMTNDE